MSGALGTTVHSVAPETQQKTRKKRIKYKFPGNKTETRTYKREAGEKEEWGDGGRLPNKEINLYTQKGRAGDRGMVLI